MAGTPNRGFRADTTVTAPLRVIPPGSAQLATDPASPWVLFFGTELEIVGLATAAVGCGFTIEGELGRVVADRAGIELLQRELAVRESELAPMITRMLAGTHEWCLRTRSLALDGGISWAF